MLVGTTGSRSHRASMRILLLSTLALTACKGLPYEPVPCHGYPPRYDTLSVNPLTIDTVYRAHVCGEPRR